MAKGCSISTTAVTTTDLWAARCEDLTAAPGFPNVHPLFAEISWLFIASTGDMAQRREFPAILNSLPTD